MASYEIRKMAEILRDGVYRVPEYQRNYAWEREQLNDLWEDLRNLNVSGTADHYTGTLIVRKLDDFTKLGKNFKRFELIDGQQRLTTLTILLYCICERLRSIGGQEATTTVQNIMSEYVHDVSADIYRLTLNGADDSFFRDVIIKQTADEMAGKGPQTASERRLRAAKDFFSASAQLNRWTTRLSKK